MSKLVYIGNVSHSRTCLFLSLFFKKRLSFLSKFIQSISGNDDIFSSIASQSKRYAMDAYFTLQFVYFKIRCWSLATYLIKVLLLGHENIWKDLLPLSPTKAIFVSTLFFNTSCTMQTSNQKDLL